MTDTQTRDIVLRAAALSENKQARARLEQDEHGTWQRIAGHLRSGKVAPEVVALGLTGADLDEYLANFIAVLAEASLDPVSAIKMTAELFTTLEKAEAAKALMTAPKAEA